MPESLPGTDARRAAQLRAELERVGSATTPGWGVATAPDSFGRALLEIAGLLAEVTTTQLDRTAERDALAFADALDIPPPAPQAASATFVLVPEESRTTPTPIPVRTQLGVSVAGDEVVFETARALQVSPCRIADVVAVDPGTDHVERAPGRVTATEAPPAAVAGLQVATAAGAGSTVLQVSPAPQLEPGDQLRILRVAYRVAKVDQDLVTLLDPLDAAVPAGTPLERIEALESFSLRNLQEHAVHLGHEALFNLEQPARIEVLLTPSGIARRLAGLDLQYAMWGTKQGDDAPAWHELGLVGGSGTTLTLRKAWHGSVDKLEVDGRTNRWLRIVHPVPVATEGVADPVDQVALRVSSESTSAGAATSPSPIGSTTVTRAFHNALPLTVTGSFLPFGPTPARFDIFTLAAPEALSKPGARMNLDIRLADASLLALAAPQDGAVSAEGTNAYGIDVSGLLHSLTISSSSDVTWRSLSGQPTGGTAPVAIDGSAGLLVARTTGIFALDVLVARDRDGNLVYTMVFGGAFAGLWLPVPEDPGAEPMLGDIVLLGSAVPGVPSAARLVRAGATGLRTCALGTSGPASAWEDVSTLTAVQPDTDQPVAMTPVRGTPAQGSATADVVLTAHDGSAWLGRIGAAPGGLGVTWTRLAPAGARADVRPAATLHSRTGAGERLWAAWADNSVGIAAWTGKPDGTGGTRRTAGSASFVAAAGSSLRTAPQPWAPWATQPLTTAVASDGQGNRSVLVWFDVNSRKRAALPHDTAAQPPTDLVIVGPPSVQGPQRSLLVMPRTGEALVVAPIEQEEGAALTAELTDGLVIAHQPDASHYVDLDGGQAPRVQELLAARIVNAAGDDRVYEVGGGGLQGATTYRFLRRIGSAAENVTGKARANGELALEANDLLTDVDHRLVIGSASMKVTAIDDVTEPGLRIATLDPSLVGTVVDDPVTYTATEVLDSGVVGADDRQTLVHLGSAVSAGDVVRFDDGAPKVLVVAADARSSDGRWWRTGNAWTTVPAAGTAVVLGDATIGAWSDRALERGYDNPELSWEFFDGEGWRRLEDGFVDGTRELATGGTVSFRVPGTLAPTEVGGREDLWIRARLVGGDYGRPRYVVTSKTDPDTNTTTQSADIDTREMHPPEIVSIEARFVLDARVAPERVLVRDNLATLDQTQASAADQARFALFSGARAIDSGVAGPAMYVCLTRSPVSPLALLAVVDDQAAEATLTAEVLTAAGWRPALVEDETAALHRTGVIQVFPSTPSVRAARFGSAGHWLRLQATTAASGGWRPVVRGLFVNGVPAFQARTVVQEILGSSLGEPSLVLVLAERPVLPETVELRVREELGEDERADLQDDLHRATLAAGRPVSEVPKAAVKVAGIDGTWVLWRRVDSFIGATGDARVYRLDPATGSVTFGDGRQGKVPPAGSDAVRAFRYQQGGGPQGNASAWSDVAVKSALEGIESVVLPFDAAGGVAIPDPTALLVTAPNRLRSAGRALAVADYEALAVAAAAQIVRARCTPPTRPGDPVVVAIAVRDGTRRPVPSLALRDAVARDLRSAAWGGLSARRLRVDPPTYVQVEVTVRLRAGADLAAQVEQAATEKLLTLLHPTEGGPGGSAGWPFGRRLWESDVLRALHHVDGIDRVIEVELRRLDGQGLDAMPSDGLICASVADVVVHVEPVAEP